MTNPTGIPGAERVRVKSMVWEAEGVLSVSLEREDHSALPSWSCGAHIDLVLPPGGLIRQYSLCSSPTDLDHYTIAVLHEPTSAGGSRYIHETLRPGAILEIVGPRNNFPLVSADEYLLIAGGIGITPLIPMLFALAQLGAEWHLLYGGRRRSSMAFLELLQQFGDRVTIRPEEEFGLLNLEDAIVGTLTGAAVYCCGPEPLIAAVEATCSSMGRAEAHVERFSARPEHLLELAHAQETDQAFTVVLQRSNLRLEVPPERTIADVLLKHHVFVPTSCTEGYCGTCETRVLAGIPDHRDDYLSPERRASNSAIMVCCSRSLTPELVLDL